MNMDHPDYAQRKERFLVHYRANLSTNSCLFPGIADMLDALECEGIRWGVVTNKISSLSQPIDCCSTVMSSRP